MKAAKRNYWIFQSTPEHYDLRVKLIAGKTESWQTQQFGSEMQPGDTVFFWLGGDFSLRGIYGSGHLVSHATPDKEGFRVDVQYDERFSSPLPSEEVRKNRELRHLKLFEGATQTSFLINEREAAALVLLVSDRGLINLNPTENESPWRPTYMTRELEDEAQYGLSVDSYALALATLFRQARGEFSIALLGAWGSGKTTLSQRLEPLLASPPMYRESLERETGAGPPDNDRDSMLNYAVVRYSAWKYRHPPETWIYLYEMLRIACDKAPIMQKFSRKLRIGIAKSGEWQLIWMLLLILVAALPLSSALRAVAAFAGAASLVGAVYGVQLFRRARNPIEAMLQRYGKIASHKEKLGLQAALGDDLRAMLMGWIPRRPKLTDTFSRIAGGDNPAPEKISHRAIRFFPWITLAALAGVWIVCVFFFLWGSVLKDCGAHAGVADKALCGVFASMAPLSGRWIFIAFVCLWVLSAIVIAALSLTQRDSTDRVLLIIDDLDRCSPEEVVDLIEAVKLLLEDPEIHARLQILTLADEAVLEHAVAMKYSALLAEQTEPVAKRDLRGQLTREHFEKLFLCELRLPQLSNVDVEDLVRRYVSPDARAAVRDAMREIEKQLQPPVKVAPSPTEVVVVRRPGNTAAEGQNPTQIQQWPKTEETLAKEQLESDRVYAEQQAAYEERRRTMGPELERAKHRFQILNGEPGRTGVASKQTDRSGTSALRFDETEIAVLVREVPKYFGKKHGVRRTPRAIRAFLFKYQLCRMLILLSRNSHPGTTMPKPEELVRLIATRGRSRAAPQSKRKLGDDRLWIERIVAQVS